MLTQKGRMVLTHVSFRNVGPLGSQNYHLPIMIEKDNKKLKCVIFCKNTFKKQIDVIFCFSLVLIWDSEKLLFQSIFQNIYLNQNKNASCMYFSYSF